MGRCKRHGCESAGGEGRECRGRAAVAGACGKCWAQKRQVRTWKWQETVEKTCKMPHPGTRTGCKTWKNAAAQGEPEERKRRQTWEDEGGRWKRTEEEEEEEAEEEDEEEEDDDDDDDHDDHGDDHDEMMMIMMMMMTTTEMMM